LEFDDDETRTAPPELARPDDKESQLDLPEDLTLDDDPAAEDAQADEDTAADGTEGDSLSIRSSPPLFLVRHKLVLISHPVKGRRLS